MASVIQSNFRIRKHLGRVRKVIEVPNLIDIQKTSYDKFLQATVPPNERAEVGLQAVFRSVFPIKDFNGTSELVFVSYNLERPKYDVEECRQRGMTYAAPIKVTTQLMIYDTREGGERIVRDIKEQEVYFGEIPLMTDTGTFIINGTERVVVSQLHRSPGVFFDHDKGKTHSSGKVLYSARIIPYRGSWLDFEFDPKDIIYVRIDRRRKMHATVLLRALGYSTQDLLNYFYSTEVVYLEKGGKYAKSVEFELLPGQRATRDIKIGNEVIVKKNTKFTKAAIKKLRDSKIDRLPIDLEELVGKVAAHDVVDKETGEVVLEVNEEVTEAKLDKLREAGIEEFKILFIDGLNVGSYLRDTLLAEKVKTTEDAIMEIYRRLRPGDPPTLETAKTLFHNLFFNPERYDLSKVGRLKLNYKFYRDLAEDQRPSLDTAVLTPQDILETVRHLIELKNGRGSVDDIDHLGNRRVRAVGELMENQYRIGLSVWSARSKSA
jgi:DNA-directed RNA polymerase subunit beta